MLRLQTPDGWWLVTHPDHAALAGDFAARWGNDLFTAPEPRAHVLRGIYAHDDGWLTRDAHPQITRAGLPSAFSRELVGAYSAFEEIDLEAYLAVRRDAVALMAALDPYAAILISMHTHNLLSARADRSTIRPDQLPLLDAFLADQQSLQHSLQQQLASAHTLSPEQLTWAALTENFRLLQACDNLSLLSCTDFPNPATLLHPLRTHDATSHEVHVTRLAERTFRLAPYPFAEPRLTFNFPARFIPGATFASNDDLQSLFAAAPLQQLTTTICA